MGLYTVGSNNIALSKQEVIEIAMNHAKSYSWRAMDEKTIG
jgi:hypothetical protein